MNAVRSAFHGIRGRWLGLAFIVVLVGGVVGGQLAHADDPTATAIRAGLTSFAQDGLGKLGMPVDSDTADHLYQLSQALPLSSLDPTSSAGLDVKNALKNAVSGVAVDSVDGLAGALNGVNTDVGAGVNVKLGTGVACVPTPCAGPDEVTISASAPYTIKMPFDATKTVHVPLRLPTDVTDLSGPGGTDSNELAIDLELKGTLTFGYDPSAAVGERFYLMTDAGGTALAFTAKKSGASTVSFQADLGFTRVTAVATLDTLDVSLAIKLVSPHSAGDANAGRITQYDWQNSQPQDLVTVTRTGSAAATFSLDSDLITATSPDITFKVSGTLSSAPGGFTPSYQLVTGATFGPAKSKLADVLSGVSLADFTNVTPGDVLSGFGQLAATLAAIQGRADVHLPFLQGGVASTIDLISKLAQMLAQQTVSCGTTDGAPPSGTLYGLKAGTTIYCRATTTDAVKADSVVWSPLAGTAAAVSHNTGSSANGTIAIAPSASAVFTTAQDYVPAVIGANYVIDGTTTSKGVSQPIPTAQELFDSLVTQAGFLSKTASIDEADFGKHLPASLTYDSSSKVLKFHLLKTFTAADNKTLHTSFDFGDRLKDSTGLFGLSPDSGASVDLKAGKAVIDVTFGVLLVSNSDLATATPAPTSRSFLDRFFVQRSDDGHGGKAPLFAIEDTSATATVKLKGQVGFVGITADGDANGCGETGHTHAFCLGAADSTKPLVALNLVDQTHADGGPGADGGSTPLGITIGSTTIADALPITVLLPHAVNHLAIAPNVRVSGGLSIAAAIGTTPLASGGVKFDWLVKKMSDLTSPVVTTSGTEATDANNLYVHADADFSNSLKQFWEMAKSDPQALLRVILDALGNLADQAATAGGGAFDTQLPLVNVTPRQLLVQFQQLKSSIDELSGGGSTLTTCVISAPVDHKANAATAAVPGDTLRCNAAYPAAATGVAWTAHVVYTNNTGTELDLGGGQKVPAGDGWAEPITPTLYVKDDGSAGTADATVATSGATDFFEFTIPDDPNTRYTGYQVHVDLDDSIGHHSADIPAKPAPSTLQAFRDWLAGKLGLNPDVLTFEIVDAPDPNNAGTSVKTLKLGLKYDVCTTGFTGCTGGAVKEIAPIEFPLNLELGDLGDSSFSPSMSTTGKIALKFKAHAQLDVGIPLGNLLPTSTTDGTSSAGQCAQGQSGDACNSTKTLFEIFNTTGATVEASADGTDLGGKASLGPLSLSFGTESPKRDGDAADPDADAHASVGKIHMGGKVTVGVPTGGSDPVTYKLGDFASAFSAAFDNNSGADSSCGSYDSDWSDNLDKDPADATKTKDPTEQQDVAGTVCGLFTLGLNDAYIGDLGMSWDKFKPATATDSASLTLFLDKAALLDKIKNATFSLDFLLKTLPVLLDGLENALSNAGGTGDNKMPVIGNALDGGAKIVGKIRDGVLAVSDGIDKYVGGTDVIHPKGMADRANAFLFLQFASEDEVTAWGHAAETPYSTWPQAKLGLLLDHVGSSAVTPEDVGVKLTCLLPSDPSDAASPKTEQDCTTDADASLLDVQSALVDMRIGEGIPAGGIDTCADEGTTGCIKFTLPFDAGLDGFPLKVSGAVEAHVGWAARLNFGISRKDGPFLMVNHGSGSTPAKDLEVAASVNLGAATGSCATDTEGQDQYVDAVRGKLAGNGLNGTGESAFPFSKSGEDGGDNCLAGTLGFLTVNAQDTNGSDAAKGIKHTGISLDAGVTFVRKDVTTYDADGTKLGIKDIGKFSAKLGVSAEANVNLMLRAGVNDASAVGFPAVYGVFHAHWEWAKSSGAAPVAPSAQGPSDLSMSQVYMDAGGLFNAYLKPIVQQVKKSTSPFKPVIDTLYTPIPVVSQLAAMVGKPPVTLIDLAEALSGNDLTMIKTILGVIKFANEFEPSGNAVLIPMGTDPVTKYNASGAHFLGGGGGYFGLDKTLVKTPQTQSSAGQLVKDPVASNGSGASSLGSAVANDTEAKKQLPADSKGKGPTLLTDPIDGTTRWQTFGVAGLDIPLLRDPSLAFQVLMGQDVTLVDYQFGGLHAQAGFSYTFGPFMVGPVPVSITIGGSVGVNGHLGIGYDTTGLRAVIGGGSPYRLLDGLFFDTYDASGRETPVLQLIGTISAGAQVDLVVVKAGIEAVLKLTINFFWDDPTPDGKMSFQDIGNKIANPICLFRVSGSLDAFLNAFVEFDFFLYSHKFSFTILKLHLLDFEGKCSPPSPEPATLNGHTLEINVGPHANRRNIAPDEKEEQAIVRMLPPPAQGGNGKQVSVAMFGAYKEYGDYNVSGGEHITKIYADGADKNDDIELQPGSATAGTGTLTDSGTSGTCTTEAPCLVPFSIPGELHGGADADTLIGGEAGNFLDGGAGSDKITGGSGNDLIQGGGDADTADGGRGADKLCSGTWASSSYSAENRGTCTAGTASVVFTGGPGGDVIVGSDDSDQLDGGPGLNPDAVDPDDTHTPKRTFASTQPAGVDGNDSIVGNLGNDAISGGAGDDDISGNTAALFGDYTCSGSGTAPGDGQTDDDVIDAGPGNDRTWGGPGVDQIKTGTGASSAPHDFACGGAGDDTITGDPTPGSAAGNDTLLGGNDRDLVTGGAGKDYVDGGPGNDKVIGADNDDDVLGGTGRDVVDGGAGDDLAIGESADVSEYDNTTGVATIDHSAAASSFKDKATNINNDTSSNSAVDCITNKNVDPTKDNLDGNEDCVIGSTGKDAMYGGGGKDTMTGDDGDDWMSGGSNDDSMRGGLGDDQMQGNEDNDTMWGDSGADTMFGNADQDTMHGGPDADYMEGNEGSDTMFGDQNDDRMMGGSASATATDSNVSSKGDTMNGGAGNDVMLGDNGTVAANQTATMTAQGGSTFGDDTMQGDDGDDQMYGEGGADTMNGGVGADWMLGDHGSISVVGTPASWPGGAANRTVSLVSPDTTDAGADVMHGDAADDHMYGGGAADTMHGDADADYMEGNGAADSMFGDDGQDDMLGGSSASNALAEKLDDGETTMDGGNAQDVMIGDNGTITRTASADGATWVTDPITSGAARTVTLTYSDASSCTVNSATVCGGDVMHGGTGNDRMYGEGGNDTMNGDADEDYLEGNQNVDTIHGDANDDDIIGGSSENPAAAGVGRPDEGDHLNGDAGNDVIAGDNAIITKTLVDAAHLKGVPGDIILQGFDVRQRTFALLDLGTSADGTFGGDDINGGDGTDVAFGQSGIDTIHGNADPDYLEGNQGDDVLFGDGGQDDILGGSSKISGSGTTAAQTATGQPDGSDAIQGGLDQDVILADNGSLLRVGVRPATVTATSRSGYLDDLTKSRSSMTLRQIDLYDLGDLPTAGTSGNDDVLGDDATNGGGDADVILGQSGKDRLRGGAGDDAIEGGPGSDRIDGDAGDDDLVGGSSTRLTAAQTPSETSSGQPDAADDIFGGAGNDVATGDNAALNRVTSASDSGVFYDVTRHLLASKNNPIAVRYLQELDLKNGTPSSYLTLPDSTRFGADQISGGDGTDVLLGQDGPDAISGGSGDDYAAGNGDADVLRGDLALTGAAPQSATDLAGRVLAPESVVAAFTDPGWPTALPADAATTDRDGPGGVDGQDDLMGGSSIQGFRDAADIIEGDGEADAELGDNGTLVRGIDGTTASGYAVYAKRYAAAAPTNAAVVRQHAASVAGLKSTRFCPATGTAATTTCEVLNAYGADRVFGDGGDDTIWGQDGNDWLRGGAGNDDMYGEQGNDTMLGDSGEDAMLGDRGGIVDTYLTPKTPTGFDGDTALLGGSIPLSSNAPPKVSYRGLVAGTVDRRVDLMHDIDGDHFVGITSSANSPVNGTTFGGDDIMRGGGGRDVLHGGYGDDLMNGDSGGDTLFGDVGADMMWGGKGCDPVSTSEDFIAGCAYTPFDIPDQGLAKRNAIVTVPNAAGTTFVLTDGSLDNEFSGKGGISKASLDGALGADLTDWRPRGDGRTNTAGLRPGCGSGPWPVQVSTTSTLDPCIWFDMTNADDDLPAVPSTNAGYPAYFATTLDNQHHEGIDWMYGGKDRDVFQADVAANGPNTGDFQADWTGVFNLWTHCNSAYGGFNDVYQLSPAWQTFMQKWAFAEGAGQAVTDVTGSTTSAYEELALVYTADINDNNSGKPYPSTPGHFDNPNACGL